MPILRKTDLAMEAHELARGTRAGSLPGVRASEETLCGLPLTRVEVLDGEGAALVGKPAGTYLTLSLPGPLRDRDDILAAARAVAAALRSLSALPSGGTALVAGLGNRAVTPDAIGPGTVDSLLVTRHLAENLPETFPGLRPVSAVAPGVSGSTGMESGELLSALVEKVRPACLIAVDALAARRQERVCRTIQLSDTGLVPGSGVGNARMALDRETLGVPVLAVGVPTVVDAATLCLDLAEEAGGTAPDLSRLRREGAEWFVTPRNVDSEVRALSKALGLGISSALLVDFSVEKVEKWTG